MRSKRANASSPLWSPLWCGEAPVRAPQPPSMRCNQAAIYRYGVSVCCSRIARIRFMPNPSSKVEISKSSSILGQGGYDVQQALV